MGGGSTDQPQPTQSTTTQISPQAQALFNAAYPNIARFAAGPPPTMYGGPMTAGFTPTQTAAQESALGAAGAQQQTANLAAGLQGTIPQVLQWGPGAAETPFQAKPLATSSNIFSDPGIWNADANTGLTSAINAATRPIYQNFQEQVLPAIRSQELSTGPFGGTRGSTGIAGGLAAAKANQQALDTASKMAQDAYAANLAAVNQRYGTNIGAEGQRYGTDVGAETAFRGQDVTAAGQRYGQNLAALYQALGATPTVQAAQSAPWQTMSAVGDVQQAMNQAQIDEAIKRYNYSQLAPLLQSQQVLSMLPSIPGATTVSTANNPPAPGMFQQSIGGAMTGAALGSMVPIPGSTLVGAGAGAMMPFLFR